MRIYTKADLEKENPGPSAGYWIDIVRSLQAKMGFEVTYTHPADLQFGALRRHENGTQYWNGMVGQESAIKRILPPIFYEKN